MNDQSDVVVATLKIWILRPGFETPKVIIVGSPDRLWFSDVQLPLQVLVALIKQRIGL